MRSSSDHTRVGRTLTLGGGAGSSLEGRDIELSVSPKDIRTSPMISVQTANRRGEPMFRIQWESGACPLTEEAYVVFSYGIIIGDVRILSPMPAMIIVGVKASPSVM